MGNRKAPTPPPVSAREVSIERIERAFTEWDRRYREDPEAFMSEATRLLTETPETYGQAATPYFVSILDSLPDV